MGTDGLRRYRDRDGDIWVEYGQDVICVEANSACAVLGERAPHVEINHEHGPLTALGASPEPTAATPARTLHQHAAALALVLADAAADGYALYDNGEYGEPIASVLLVAASDNSAAVIRAPRTEG